MKDSERQYESKKTQRKMNLEKKTKDAFQERICSK